MGVLPNIVIQLQEFKEGLLNYNDIKNKVASGELVLLQGKRKRIVVGPSSLLKVNTSIGCSTKKDIKSEIEKFQKLIELDYGPDMMMDLSIVETKPSLWQVMANRFDGPIGTLPHYLCYSPRKGIDKKCLLEKIQEQAEMGVAWMTLHLTSSKTIYQIAERERNTPTTSRGGGIILKDMFIHNKKENVFMELYEDIMPIFQKHHMAVSLGTTFRPATVVDALDEAHMMELREQVALSKEIHDAYGIPVMLEPMGHVPLNKIFNFQNIVRNELRFQGPLMTLGPLPTDAAVGEDHIANAIGAAFAGWNNVTNIINSITREEHTGNIPTIDSIIEGLKSARIAAHVVNMALFPSIFGLDQEISKTRGNRYTCVVEGGLFTDTAIQQFAMGCNRCGNECPLLFNYSVQKNKPNVEKE